MWKTSIKVGGTFISASITAVLTTKDVQEFATPFGFQVPGALIAFVVFLFFVAWWIIGLETYKHRIENSKSKLVFKKAGEWQFYNANGQPIYHALQTWFINNPEIATDDSVAKNITATITFYNLKTKTKNEIYGCFTEAEFPDYATIAPIKNLKDEIDIWSPNAIPQKLLIALKYPDDESAYGFAKSNFSNNQYGKQPDNEISKVAHYVKVCLKGTRVYQQPFWFRLNNPGKNETLVLSKPIKKPNLRKEGFQT